MRWPQTNAKRFCHDTDLHKHLAYCQVFSTDCCRAGIYFWVVAYDFCKLNKLVGEYQVPELRRLNIFTGKAILNDFFFLFVIQCKERFYFSSHNKPPANKKPCS